MSVAVQFSLVQAAETNVKLGIWNAHLVRESGIGTYMRRQPQNEREIKNDNE